MNSRIAETQTERFGLVGRNLVVLDFGCVF